MARPPFNAQPVREGPRANQDITADRILLIDHLGEKHGEVSRQRGLDLAAEAGLDLVEVSPNASPPVCKILDLGKLKYETQKKQNIQRKKQKTIDIKEVKMRPGIETHDYEVKRRNMVRFLEDGDKVKVTLRFRGREMAHQELGLKVLDRVRDDLDELAKVEQMPKMEGRQMVMVMVPR